MLGWLGDIHRFGVLFFDMGWDWVAYVCGFGCVYCIACGRMGIHGAGGGLGWADGKNCILLGRQCIHSILC